MSGEIMSLEMDVFCLLLLIRILYQMYINREQNDYWNYFYHTIAGLVFICLRMQFGSNEIRFY